MKVLKRIFLNDRIILALIFINAIVIFLQGFPSNAIDPLTHKALTLMDDLITILFVLELGVKSRHFGWKEYLKPAWNKFDVLLILLSIPPLIASLLPLLGTAPSSVGFLLVFRVLRVFKFFRFIQFFPQVEHIFRSIHEALKASFMVLVGFLVCIFIMAIFSCYLYQDIAPEHFGDPIRAYYSMFIVFTIEGWNTIPEAIAAKPEITEWQAFFTKLYFITILIFGGVIGLSIVNSIFVDAMVSDNNDQLEEQVASLEEEIANLNKKMDVILERLPEKES